MRSQSGKILFTSILFLLATGLAYSQDAYRDDRNGVSLSLPPGWTWSDPQTLSDQKSIAVFRETGTQLEAKLWVQILTPPEELMPTQRMNHRLLKEAQRKVEQRRREGYENYHLRDNSCELKAINGRPASRCVAQYTVRDQTMVEYFTRVRSESTNAFFFARMRAEQFEDFKARLDPVIETLQIQ
jgi:hypothetical protein